MRKIFVAGFILVFMLVGCSYHSGEVTTGKALNEAAINKIVDGETTGGQILAWFGAPSNSSRLGKEELFVYKHCTTDSSSISTVGLGRSGAEEKCNELSVVLGEDGIVKNHGFVAAPN